jgi:peptidoglycan hydrolase-like protein with peptidoglycan-binding domain
MSRRLLVAVVLVLALSAAPARAGPAPELAAVQAALRALGLYGGTVDGLAGPRTAAAVRAFQRRHGLAVDGVPGPRTRAVLERRTPGRLDVALLQFRLALHGFPSGRFDGRYGDRTRAAVRAFQRFSGLSADGVAGRATLAALRGAPPRCPIALRRPVHAPLGDPFGPRDDRFHAGADFTAPAGVPVVAAAPGTVTWAAPRAGGWGLTVVVARGGGVRTFYSHLGRIEVSVGRRVETGGRLGTVGATGNATGPHLHFEVRVRGAAVDPVPAIAC